MSAIVVLTVVLGLCVSCGREASEQSDTEAGSTDTEQIENGGGKAEDSETLKNVGLTEEDRTRIESQTGVTVTEDGSVQIDVEVVQAEEESMPVSRQEAEALIIKELGDGAEITSMSVRKEQDRYCWAASAVKGGDAYQVWIDAETGETFLKQKE